MSKKWYKKPKPEGYVADEHRYAVIFARDQEVLCANFRSIGAAFNAATYDYIPNTGIIVVKTLNDIILSEVRRNGHMIKNRGYSLPKDIWNRS